MSEMKLYLRLLANAAGLKNELTGSKTAVGKFTSFAKQEFKALREAAGSVQGKLAGLGITVGGIMLMKDSARLDKVLIQIGQTAGESKENVKGLREELFRMGEDTGSGVDNLKDGFNSLIQSGLSWKASLESTKGINIASAVTGADASVLAGGVTVGATAFKFDLEKPRQAVELLDRMTVAGRLGNAELQNLSDIFARVGVNAASAGMGFDKTLGFIEALSMVERQPERLATLADSTLRVFTNLRYMESASKATGIKFFDAKGSRRDALAVLKDIKKEYDKQKTEKDKAVFIQKAFGHSDLDTIKGIKTLLDGSALMSAERFSKMIGSAGGTLERDLPDAVNNAADQVGRLKTTLVEAADSFAQPINKALSELIKFGLTKKEEEGLGLTGGEMIAGGAAIGAGAFLLSRYGNVQVGNFLKGKAGLAAGIAEGKLLEKATGVTPVFVTNWPASFGNETIKEMPGGIPTTGGIPTKIGKALTMGQVGLAAAFGFSIYEGAKYLLKDTAIGKGVIGDKIYDLVESMRRNDIERQQKMDEFFYGIRESKGHGDQGKEIQNNIKIDVYVDKDGNKRVISEGNRPSMLDRGTFN